MTVVYHWEDRERKEEDPEMNCVNGILKKKEGKQTTKVEGKWAHWSGKEAQEERKSAGLR